MADERSSAPSRADRTWLSMSQVAASLGNFLLVLAAAGRLPPSGVGVIGLVLAVYLIALAIGRGIVGDPALLRAAIGRDTAAVAGSAAIIGLATALVAAAPLAALLPDARLVPAYVVLAMPLLVMQDALRYAAFGQSRPRDAAVSDLVWLVLSAVGLAIAVLAGSTRPADYVLAWIGGGVVATLVLMRFMRAKVSVVDGWKSLNRDRRLRVSTALDSTATNGAQQVSFFAIAIFAGVGQAGVVRFLLAWHGPVTLLFAAMYVDGIWSVRTAPDTVETAARRVATRMAVILAVASIGAGLAFLVVPEGWGSAVAGETFSRSRGPMVVFTIAQVMSAFATAAVSGLRYIGRVDAAVRIRILWALLLLVAGGIGSALADAMGYCAALCLANAAGAVLWWRALWSSGAIDQS
jgi:O-antigen/teichoic acid export membrane protein